MSATAFDVSNLVPAFREAEVDSYFAAFECIAGALQWPSDIWLLLFSANFLVKLKWWWPFFL